MSFAVVANGSTGFAVSLGAPPPGPSTATDDFDRANGGLGANWANVFNSFSIVGNAAQGGVGGARNFARWVGTIEAPNDQWSEVVIGTTTPGTSWAGPAVRLDGSGNGYMLSTDNGSQWYFSKFVSGVETSVFWYVNQATSPGDVIRLGVVGTSLTMYLNGVSIATYADATHASGQPGIFTYGIASVASWSGLVGASAGGILVKHWSGSVWVDKTAAVKYWTGAAWSAKPAKQWSGTAWS